MNAIKLAEAARSLCGKEISPAEFLTQIFKNSGNDWRALIVVDNNMPAVAYEIGDLHVVEEQGYYNPAVNIGDGLVIYANPSIGQAQEWILAELRRVCKISMVKRLPA